MVPIYLETQEGNMLFLGRVRMVGNDTIQQSLPLKGLKNKPRRALLNYYDDVLASPN